VNQNSLNSLPANFANEGLKDLNGSTIAIRNVSLPQMSENAISESRNPNLTAHRPMVKLN
jgi:hypothetical protein